MNDKESPFNLFSSRGKKPSPEDKPAPALKKSPKQEPASLDPQTQSVLNQIQDMQNALKSRIDYITSKSGMSKEDVMKLISTHPGSKQEMDKMNADLKVFAEKVWSTVKTEGGQKKTELTAKERKAKTLGSRRNWMKMP